jgi:molybdopterin-guanine dinucleotide biosynthesis protein A
MFNELLSLVINAGGLSRRMGQAKALLPLPPDGTPLIVHILRRLAPLVTDRTVVVSNDPAITAALDGMNDVLILPDHFSMGCALGGVATGLQASSGWAMVVACDMPLVDPQIFAQLMDHAEVAVKNNGMLDAIIPRVAGQAQPFHGLWHRRALPVLAARLANGELGVQAALAALNVVWMDERMLGIEPDVLAFLNVNTPQEWAEALAILANKDRPVA